MGEDPPRYHVELRAFPHVARVFNLDRETLDRRFVGPWVAGELIDYDDHRWAPDRTRLTVLEGAEVDARGLGRGWGEVTRRARDVTEQVVVESHRGAEARPEVEALKEAIAEVAGRPLRFPDAIALAIAAQPRWRASEQLALAEQAVWELLHQDRLQLIDGEDEPVARERWQAIVSGWATWTAAGGDAVRMVGRVR